MGIYLENFREIRWIHDYMLERALQNDEIFRVNNDKQARDCMKALIEILGSVCANRLVPEFVSGI